MNFELVQLKSGPHSIRSLRHGETMHIGDGPRIEAFELYVRQQRLVERAQAARGRAQPFVIWDVGLGPAGNALTALEALRGVETAIELHSFEICTEVIEFTLANAAALDYMAGWEASVAALLAEGEVKPLPNVRWVLHRGDYLERMPAAPPPAAIFHDPYSPARNPEMWSLEVFRAARERAREAEGNTPCLLTNYTRSTAVRVTLALAGWYVGIGVPTGDKDQTTTASNALEWLERPLDRSWLSRVRVSSNAAPLRGGIYKPGPISDEDFAALEALPQFA